MYLLKIYEINKWNLSNISTINSQANTCARRWRKWGGGRGETKVDENKKGSELPGHILATCYKLMASQLTEFR